MTYDHRNLANTVRPVYLGIEACSVGHSIDPYQNGGRIWTDSHRWAPGQRPTGVCLDCGRTLRQLRRKPERTTGGLARAIASTPADVPRIQ